MQILVYDDAHRPKALKDDRRWDRWSSRTPSAWHEEAGQPGRYQSPSQDGDWSELRYRHVVPDPAQWEAIVRGNLLPQEPRASLITDFYSYNTELTNESASHPLMASKPWRQPHWVGDLTLSFTLDLPADARTGRFRVELVKAGISNRCEFDLAADTVALWHGDQAPAPAAPAGLSGGGSSRRRHTIRFANVDDRLTLWVDDRLPFGEGVSFDPGDAIAPTAADLDPVGIASKGVSIEVSDLKLTRDIYYTLQPGRADYDSLDLTDPLPNDPVGIFDWLADPNRFAAFGKLGPRDFPVGAGRYMMFGDNSPWSRDGRDWRRVDQIDLERPGVGWDSSGRESWEVPESLLVGKAFCVYWPHLKPFWPNLRFGRDLRLPARPNFENMRWVR
jgi:signal peptidase I